MKADDEEPEMPLAKHLRQHAPSDLRIPIVEGRKHGKQNSANNNVVEMGHHKIRVGQLPIEGRRSQHDASEPRNKELKQEGDAEQHRRSEDYLAAPDRCQPVEYFHS